MELKIGDVVIIEDKMLLINKETPCFFYTTGYKISKKTLTLYEDIFIATNCVNEKIFGKILSKKEINLCLLVQYRKELSKLKLLMSQTHCSLRECIDDVLEIDDNIDLDKESAKLNICNILEKTPQLLLQIKNIISKINKFLEEKNERI